MTVDEFEERALYQGGHDYPPYLCAQLPIEKIDNEFIRQVLEKFETE